MPQLACASQYRMTRRLIGLEEFRLNEGYKENSVGCVSFSLENPAAVHELPYGALIDGRLQYHNRRPPDICG